MTSQHSYPAAVLLDHDGTLVNTEPLWEQAKERIAREHGTHWSAEDTRAVLGYSIEATLLRLQKVGVDLPLDELEQKLTSYMHEIFAESEYEFLPGIRPFLQELKDAGVPAAIVTNATTSVAERTAGLAPGAFSAVIGDQQTEHSKPHPEPYLKAAEALGVDPKDCVAVEDSPSGTRSALDAGMRVIVVPGEVAVPEDLGHARIRHEELSLEKVRALFGDEFGDGASIKSE